MPYNITTNPEYIRVYYWGNGGSNNRHNHTNQLMTFSKIYQQYKFLIDTRDLDSIMHPVDFDNLAEQILRNNLKPQTKIAILCDVTNHRTMYARFILKCVGIKCEIFNNNESARSWLINKGL